MLHIMFVCLFVSCSTERSKKGECCIYRSQLEMSLVWPERRCLVWPERRCLVWPETVISCMAGAEVSRMAADDC